MTTLLNTWLLLVYLSSTSTSITMQEFSSEADCRMIAEKIEVEIRSSRVKTDCIKLMGPKGDLKQ